MTHFYGSKAQPMAVFGEGTDELAAFYEALNSKLPGATALMHMMQSLWDPTATKYTWHLPDGHTATFKVTVPVDKRIEVDELDHATFTHRCYVNQPVERGLAMAANITHSIDGFIVREMVRKAAHQGFDLLTIHDSFWCHPNYVNKMRQNYNDIFAEYINIGLFNSIFQEISNSTESFSPLEDLHKHFYDAEYAIT